MSNEIPEKIRPTGEGSPVAPGDAAWRQLADIKRQRAVAQTGRTPRVDVIIPVYQGYDETMACVFAAVATTLDEACEIVVIDDAGPDRQLGDELAHWSRAGLFSLSRNAQNLGFVRTVNHGMSLHRDRDVVLLNSDAIVHGDWLSRLQRIATSQPNVGTVTPFSNNAEICSYPLFVTNNHEPLEVDDDLLDSLAAGCNEATHVALPTAVGFCMYIRRPCLDEVGELDAQKFGKGYGEENDFCLRATSKGWLHLLAANVFVRHCGGVSFGAGKAELVQKGLAVLARDWPDYDREIQRFLAADPVFPARRALDAARVRQASKQCRTLLFVTHDWGGGIERHVQDMRCMLARENVSLLVMRSQREREDWVALEHSTVPSLPNLQYRIKDDYPLLLALLRDAGVLHVHVHSFAGYPVDADEFIARLASDLAARYDFTAHDYLPMCPRITLIDGSGVYCGEPPEDVCIRCIATNGAPVPVEAVPRYRERYRRFLAGARRVFAPSRDTATRYEKWFPFLQVCVRPHPHDYAFGHPLPVHYRGEGILRIAVIGAIGRHKGSALLLACARDALMRGLPIRFVVFGFTDTAELDGLSCVTVKGAYQDGELSQQLVAHRCHAAFFASVWPETWSYTLSEALDAGLFPVAFDLGAMAERIRDTGWGERLPVDLMTKPGLVNEALLAMRSPPFTLAVRERIRATDHCYRNLIGEYYGLPA